MKLSTLPRSKTAESSLDALIAQESHRDWIIEFATFLNLNAGTLGKHNE